jgi:hypothetical protein
MLRNGLPSSNRVPAKGFRVTPGIYREVYSHSLSHESFRQGTTYSLVVTRFLSR